MQDTKGLNDADSGNEEPGNHPLDRRKRLAQKHTEVTDGNEPKGFWAT